MADAKDPLFRYLTLLQLIPRWPGRISTPVLQEKLKERGFDINLRSLQRDLRDRLTSFPLHCYSDERPYRWGYAQGALFDPSCLPAQDIPSALALYLAQSHLAYLLPKSVMDQLSPQFQVAYKYLEGMEQNGLSYWARRVRSLPNGKALLPAKIEPQVWMQVSTALVERKQLRITYLSRTTASTKTLEIHPLGLVTRHSISYLIATVWHYEDLRQFALHRVQQAEVLELPACERADFDTDTYIASGAFSARQISPEVELVADIHPQTAWLLKETPLSHQQSLEPLPSSDWYRLRAQVLLDEETLWWIFGLNDRIRVHAPAVWVEAIKDKLRCIQKMYEAEEEAT